MIENIDDLEFKQISKNVFSAVELPVNFQLPSNVKTGFVVIDNTVTVVERSNEDVYIKDFVVVKPATTKLFSDKTDNKVFLNFVFEKLINDGFQEEYAFDSWVIVNNSTIYEILNVEGLFVKFSGEVQVF